MRTKRKKTADKLSAKWKDSNYVKAYRLALDGLNDTKVAAALGVSNPTFRRWKKERKALRLALKQARGGGKVAASFRDYVQGRLPAALKPLWDSINQADVEENPERRVEALLAGQGEDVRKHLFVHAWVSSNFNKPQAYRLANVSPSTLRRWMSDPEFVALMDQVQVMKKEFVDGCLMNLIANGDTSATIFASKTLNRDMGYDQKVTVEHSGTVKHDHLDYEALPLEIKKAILDWMQATGKDAVPAAMLPAHHDAEDAEYVVRGTTK